MIATAMRTSGTRRTATNRGGSFSSTSTASSWTRSASTTAGTGTSLAPGGTRSSRRPNGSATLGSARRGHRGDPRRPQKVPVLAAYVLGGDRTGDPAGHPPGLPADLERWRRRRRRGRSANAAGQVTLSGYPPWTHSPPAWCPIRRSTGKTRGPARTGCAARKAPSRRARSGTSRRSPAPGAGRGAAGVREDAQLRQPPGPVCRADQPHRDGAGSNPFTVDPVLGDLTHLGLLCNCTNKQVSGSRGRFDRSHGLSR